MSDTNKIISPHDKLFKHAMSDLRVARDFFSHHLPENIKELVKLDSLKIRKESFVDNELKHSITDMLFSADTIEQNKAYLYLLVEHQSTPQLTMPFRLMKYMMQIMDQHLKEQKTEALPIVYPIIFYNGKKPYAYSTSFFELFGSQQELVKELINNPFRLVDLNNIPDEELRSHQWAGLMEFTMKHVFARDFIPILRQTLDLFDRLENNDAHDYNIAVLTYLVSTANISSKEEFLNLLEKELPKPVGGNAMTLADMLRKEGMQQGIQQGHLAGLQEGIKKGVQKGLEKGRMEGVHEMIVRLLSKGSSLSFVANVTGLSEEQVEQIRLESSLTKH